MSKGIPKSGINKGWIKKKQHYSPETEFKKGQISSRKGTKIDREKYPNMGHFKSHTKEAKERMSKARK